MNSNNHYNNYQQPSSFSNVGMPYTVPSRLQYSNHLNETSFHSYNCSNTFYLSLPSGTYHVTYTELHPLDISRLLNHGIPDHQLSHHYNIQFLIQQQIEQQAQQSFNSQTYQQQQIPCSGDYICNNTSSTLSNATISNNDIENLVQQHNQQQGQQPVNTQQQIPDTMNNYY